MSFGVDTADLMHSLADMTAQVLGGATPREIPFQQQTKFELVLNLLRRRSVSNFR